jgi:transposase
MPERRRKHSPEFKDEAARMVVESSRSIAEEAREIQVNETTLGNWVAKYRDDHAGDEPPLSMSERARLRELEREVRELRMKSEFFGKAAAFFAQEYRGARNTSSSSIGGAGVRERARFQRSGVVLMGDAEWVAAAQAKMTSTMKVAHWTSGAAPGSRRR